MSTTRHKKNAQLFTSPHKAAPHILQSFTLAELPSAHIHYYISASGYRLVLGSAAAAGRMRGCQDGCDGRPYQQCGITYSCKPGLGGEGWCWWRWPVVVAEEEMPGGMVVDLTNGCGIIYFCRQWLLLLLPHLLLLLLHNISGCGCCCSCFDSLLQCVVAGRFLQKLSATQR